jgi:hypothetical protein
MSICIGDVMSTEQSQKSFGKAGAWSITPLQRPASRVIEGPQYEEPTGGPEEWQKLLNSLQQWVCELLIKNQELRMALESAAAQEKEKYTLPVLAGTRRKLRMNIDQKINSIADSNQEVTKVLYTAKTHTSGGRRGGVSRSDDGRLDLKFGAPGVPETGTNPEQLFAAGWSACFISAMGMWPAK